MSAATSRLHGGLMPTSSGRVSAVMVYYKEKLWDAVNSQLFGFSVADCVFFYVSAPVQSQMFFTVT